MTDAEPAASSNETERPALAAHARIVVPDA
jgi:hypothetical protein